MGAQTPIPFSIARVYWIDGIPGGQAGGGSSFKLRHVVIIALSGNFDVSIDVG